MIIVTNKIQCLLCGDIIESKHAHALKYCSCRKCAVDGGDEYLRRIGSPKYYKDLSVYFYEEEDEPADEEINDEKKE